MARRPANAALAESDASAQRLQEALGNTADVLPPSKADEPILAPSVRTAIFEWLAEIRAKEELDAVGIKPRSSALLYGPPGTGKTTLAHHLAARLNLPIAMVGAENLISKWLGESGSNVSRLFDGVKKAGVDCIVFVDEFDAIGSDRKLNTGGGADNERSATMSVLLRKIEQFEGIFIAATNLQEQIDPALWRRFGMQIEVARPDFEARWAIIAKYLSPYTWDDDAISELALLFEGASPALIRQVVEGIKRSLVIGPRVKRLTDSAEAVLKPIVASVSVPPAYTPPPLWSNVEKSVRTLSRFEWPPVLNAA
ncbi:AAA ATPase, central domain protein [uncultured Pleomorphomonas sp.]|uniref:AAA ATPase, central domain protein n=1 Tax=uncultured Pleomorphomonas sp. TaxID=442121 RepID=A0A212L2E6_9HYPH|nr:ATP-binding protein [uncultured Pleomorphomonas sp.]SCM71686.1 AAA ATPase, central domain protein [uncultured Pleomorphomonas sp.]